MFCVPCTVGGVKYTVDVNGESMSVLVLGSRSFVEVFVFSFLFCTRWRVYIKYPRPINLLKPNDMYRVSQEEWTKLRESVPYVELYRYNPKHLYPKLNGYEDNGQRSLKL